MTDQTILHSIVATFVRNETVGGEYGSLADLAPNMSESEAYQVQTRAVAALVEQGDIVVGKKIAATNNASLKPALTIWGPSSSTSNDTEKPFAPFKQS